MEIVHQLFGVSRCPWHVSSAPINFFLVCRPLLSLGFFTLPIIFCPSAVVWWNLAKEAPPAVQGLQSLLLRHCIDSRQQNYGEIELQRSPLEKSLQKLYRLPENEPEAALNGCQQGGTECNVAQRYALVLFLPQLILGAWPLARCL